MVFSILLVFLHKPIVGERRNFCFAEMRRPAYRRFGYNIICIFSTQCLAQKFITLSAFFSFVTNPSSAASMSGCRGRQSLHICVYSLSAAKSLRSLRILLCIRNYKSGAEICSPTPLCFGLQLCTSSFIILHRLVGLRRMRLCPFLVSKVEQEIYSDRGFAP